jgi:hypothetical protein
VEASLAEREVGVLQVLELDVSLVERHQREVVTPAHHPLDTCVEVPVAAVTPCNRLESCAQLDVEVAAVYGERDVRREKLAARQRVRASVETPSSCRISSRSVACPRQRSRR